MCLLLLLVITRLDYKFAARGEKPLLVPQINSEDSNDFAKYHNKNFRVTMVIDGDTIDIDIPDGTFKSTRIRLLGVDTPETKDDRLGQMYFGPEAAQFTKERAADENVIVLLDEISPTRDKYKRLLAYVKLADREILNEVLIIEGFAYADLRFEHAFYEKYSRLEEIARQNKKGLWKEVKRDQLPAWLQRMRPKLLND